VETTTICGSFGAATTCFSVVEVMIENRTPSLDALYCINPLTAPRRPPLKGRKWLKMAFPTSSTGLNETKERLAERRAQWMNSS